MNVKQILPIEVNYKIKHSREFRNQKTPDVHVDSSNNRRVFFLDAPAYGNMGDQAIAFAMEKFMADVLPEYQQIEITEDRLPSSINWLKQNINANDLICLTGGGNMGVMYQRYEAVRRLVIKNFPENPIIIFPQTFDYGSSGYARAELKNASNLYGKAEHLVLCARDKRSFQRMQEAFPDKKVIFCPDIVLYLDYRDLYIRSENIGICLRSDRESVIDQKERKNLQEQFPDYIELSTADNTNTYITIQNRRRLVEQKLQEFGSMKLVITDRLHGTIFSYITNTPVIALPNSNGKVEEVCKYLAKRGNVQFTDHVTSEPGTKKEVNEDFKDAFGELKDVVESYRDG